MDRPRREVKFRPNPPRKTSRLNTTKAEEASSDANQSQQPPTREPSEHLPKRRGRVEKKAPVQVVFSHGVTSTSIRSFGRQKEMTDDGSIADYSEAPPATGEMQKKKEVAGSSIVKKNKEYQDPWDNYGSYHPTTLPLRRPGSGNPGISEMFLMKPNLTKLQSMMRTLLMLLHVLNCWIERCQHLNSQPQDQDDKSRMLLFMFPSPLPRPTNANSKETDDNLKAVEESVKSEKGKGKGISLEELPEGYMGKMLVYKSGAVKLKLGDILYDVSPGCETDFAQNVMAVNVKGGECCNLGEVREKAMVTPDMDYLS